MNSPDISIIQVMSQLINVNTISAKCSAVSSVVCCLQCWPLGWAVPSRACCSAPVIIFCSHWPAWLPSSCHQAPGTFSGCWCSVNMQLVDFCLLAVQYLAPGITCCTALSLDILDIQGWSSQTVHKTTLVVFLMLGQSGEGKLGRKNDKPWA